MPAEAEVQDARPVSDASVLVSLLGSDQVAVPIVENTTVRTVVVAAAEQLRVQIDPDTVAVVRNGTESVALDAHVNPGDVITAAPQVGNGH